MSSKEKLSYNSYRKQVKEISKKQSDNLGLFLFVGITYICFGTMNMAGRILLSFSYQLQNNLITNKNGSPLVEPITVLANIEFILFYLSAPFSLTLVSQLVLKFKFRLLLFISSLGPQLFLIIPIYFLLCNDDYDGICNRWLIFFVAGLVSALAGILEGMFMFALLYYFTNISKAEDKALYYGGFFILYNFQWMSAPLLGELIMKQFVGDSQAYLKYYIILVIVTFVISLLFLLAVEPSYQSSRLRMIRNFFKGQFKQDQQIPLMNGSNQNLSSQQIPLSQNSSSLVAQKSNSGNQIKSLTLQYFSMEANDLQNLIQNKSNSSGNLILDEGTSYWQKIYITWQFLMKESMSYLLPLILMAALIQTFAFLGICQMSTIWVSYKLNASQTDATNEGQFALYSTLQGFIYYGIGKLFGSFALGIWGDLKDKIKATIWIIALVEFGLIIGWVASEENMLFLNSLFTLILGFCDASLISTLISILAFEYTYHVYMIDLLFFLYNISQAFCSAILIIFNLTYLEGALILMQILGIVCIVSASYYYKALKNYQLCGENSSLAS